MKSKIWRKFYECDCSSEGVVLSNEYEDDNIPLLDMAFFNVSHFGKFPLSFKERLRWAWFVLKRGIPFLDCVVLNKKGAEELGTDLLKWSEGVKDD